MNEKNMILPDAIFLDATALHQLYTGSSGVPFLEIQDNAKRIKAAIIAPEIAVQDFICSKIRDAYKELNRCQTAIDSYNKIIGTTSLQLKKPDKIDVCIEENPRNFLTNTDIEIIATPNDIDFDNIIKMAIHHEVPFEEKDKGFKDTLLLLTIQNHSLRKNFKNIMLISGDYIFSDARLKKRLIDEGIQLSVVENIFKAREFLENNIKNFVTESIKIEKEKIKKFLDANFENIATYLIDNTQATKDFVEGTWSGIFGSKQSAVVGTVKKISAVRPKEITNVYPGIVKHGLDEKPGFKYVTFTVTIEMDIIVERYGLGPFRHDKPKFPLSELSAYENMPEGSYELHEEEETIERGITVEAEILIVNDAFNRLTILNIYANW
jgi:hypothetical protein